MRSIRQVWSHTSVEEIIQEENLIYSLKELDDDQMFNSTHLYKPWRKSQASQLAGSSGHRLLPTPNQNSVPHSSEQSVHNPTLTSGCSEQRSVNDAVAIRAADLSLLLCDSMRLFSSLKSRKTALTFTHRTVTGTQAFVSTSLLIVLPLTESHMGSVLWRVNKSSTLKHSLHLHVSSYSGLVILMVSDDFSVTLSKAAVCVCVWNVERLKLISVQMCIFSPQRCSVY